MDTNYGQYATVTEAKTGADIVRYDWDAQAAELFDMLANAQEQGVDLATIAEQLGCQEHVARRTIVYLRQMLADDTGDMSVITASTGRGRVYKLVSEGGAEVDAWLNFSRKYVESRISTVRQVYAALVRSAHNEMERQHAARILRHVERIMEDIAEFEAIQRDHYR